jgi:RNA polymerase sigma-70 factor (ECF subfamily)
MTENDSNLVMRLRRGEQRSFDEFFNEYYPKLYRFVRRRLRDDTATCEDVAQATICRALESLHTFRGEAALFTWLCTICRRELSTRWRERAAYSSGPALAEDDPEIRAALESLLSSEANDPEAATGRAELAESILAVLDYLPAPYADVLEWKYVRELSVEEIAGRLGRSLKATESLLTRSREAFREAFTVLRGVPTGGVA